MVEPGTQSAVHGSDAMLWTAAMAGDTDAFATLYDRHVEAVHRVLVRRIGELDAADLTAEVFALAWTHRDRIRLAEPGGLRPWLLGTAINVARKSYDRTLRAGHLRERIGGWASTDPDPFEVAIDTLDDAAAVVRAEAALASLSTDDQEVLILCVLEGMAPADAATQLGQPPGTVRSRLSRARRRLAHAYETNQHAGGPE